MGFLSGKKPVYKLNKLRLNHAQQEDFLKNHMKMTTRDIVKFKKQAGNNKLLISGKTMTEGQFKQAIAESGSGASSRWEGYLKEKQMEYDSYQDELRKERIKKSRIKEDKSKRAEDMVRKLTGKETKEDKRPARHTSVKSGISAKDRRVNSMRNSFINPEKTAWQNVENNKSATVHDINKKVETDNQVKENNKSKATNLRDVKKKSKNLPTLQI